MRLSVLESSLKSMDCSHWNIVNANIMSIEKQLRQFDSREDSVSLNCFGHYRWHWTGAKALINQFWKNFCTPDRIKHVINRSLFVFVMAASSNITVSLNWSTSYHTKLTHLATHANGLLLVDKLSFSLSCKPAFKCLAIMSAVCCNDLWSIPWSFGLLAIVMIARTSMPESSWYSYDKYICACIEYSVRLQDFLCDFLFSALGRNV